MMIPGFPMSPQNRALDLEISIGKCLYEVPFLHWLYSYFIIGWPCPLLTDFMIRVSCKENDSVFCSSLRAFWWIWLIQYQKLCSNNSTWNKNQTFPYMKFLVTADIYQGCFSTVLPRDFHLWFAILAGYR